MKVLSCGLSEAAARISPVAPSTLKASRIKHQLRKFPSAKLGLDSQFPLPHQRLGHRLSNTRHPKPRKPLPFRTVPSFLADVDYLSLRLVKSIAASTGYNLMALYSHLLEEGHSCAWFDGRNALHFELSYRTWREMLMTHIQIQTASHVGRSRESSHQRRLCRSKSADANPPNVYKWFKGSSHTLDNKVDCFVFASGAVIVWGLKPQLHVRSHADHGGICRSRTSHTFDSQNLPDLITESDLRRISQANASWNNDLASGTLWFLSQFAEFPVRADWISEDCIHYSEGQERPRRPRNEKGRRKFVERINNDHLYLKTSCLKEKFAASLALQQNVILGVFEEAFESNIKSLGHEAFMRNYTTTQDFPSPLRGNAGFWNSAVTAVRDRWQRRSLSSRPLQGSSLVQKVADLYVKVIDINLVQKITDVPEYFWEHPEHQKVWRSVHAYMEIHSRVALLNNRCTWTQQLLSDLTHTKQDAREVQLTWICILWIIAYVTSLLVECMIERRR
eukprot:Gregarina_sp_Poly_1__11011@NODE_877_length_5897_cov_644_465180_g285_i3_p2_GENE_NODE_877_length_5897_cov_644_465180_g285_i3NODE_877_length_5897_cov_644_465180_g285_i3_p2_ORF_typecomplete_len505_score31_48DUF155/PF02582_14/3_7e26_NODE_877_length_5897_cov_644_465180_g285_i318083322